MHKYSEMLILQALPNCAVMASQVLYSCLDLEDKGEEWNASGRCVSETWALSLYIGLIYPVRTRLWPGVEAFLRARLAYIWSIFKSFIHLRVVKILRICLHLFHNQPKLTHILLY